MANIEIPDFRRKRSIPGWVKLAILVLVIFGISLRACWSKYEKKNIIIKDVQIENITKVSVDVTFTIENQSYKSGKQNIMIKVYTSKGEVITSRLTQIEIESKTTKGYIKVMEKLERPLWPGETYQKATVELFKSTIFQDYNE